MIDRKIFIVAPSWVGDMVMSQSLFKRLKKAMDCQLDVFASSWATGILGRMPEVNQVIENPFAHGELRLIDRIRLGFSLRQTKYDQVFVLPNSLKSAIVPAFMGSKQRIGYIGECRYGLINNAYQLDKEKLPTMVERLCGLSNYGKIVDGIEPPQLLVDQKNQTELINKLGLLDKFVIFCPGAEYGPAKRWPPEYFAQVANSLLQKNLDILILGSNKDKEIGNKIIAEVSPKYIDRVKNLCGRTTLSDTVDLFDLAQVCITNDSGLMHIACATKCPVIAIYGSSSPSFTPPLSPLAKILSADLGCVPCFKRTCRFNHYLCLKVIKPEMVYKELIPYII